MFNNSTLARRVRVASALGLASLLSAGIYAPTFAAPNPNPPIRSGNLDRNQRGNARRGDVLRGVVSRVYSANSFDLRADDNRVYRVNMRVPLGLQTQSEVRVVGDLNGSTLEARLVTVGDFAYDNYNDGGYDNGNYGNNGGYDNGGYNNAPDNGNYNNGGYNNGSYNNGGNVPAPNYQGQQVTLTGRVTRIYSRTDMEVRDDDDGTIYRVRTDYALPTSVREGDRIEARGELNGNTIRANSAIAIGDNVNNGAQNNAGTYVTFSGPILSIDLNRDEAQIRAGNGYTYTLRARRAELNNFRVGQNVRVQGNWTGERVEVTQLTRE